ncbi:MAG: 16S rRNA (cytosine(1402)-N(4))-methyltransferase RsmH [Lentisphaeria bacterium]
MECNFHHISVLPKESVELLLAANGGRFIDCTLGAGGHSRLILEASSNVELIGIDRDLEALAAAKENLAEFGDRVSFFHGNFSNMKEFCAEKGWDKVDGILMDIGVSSHQLDKADRGFSFRENGPLDMRMNQKSALSASTIINQYSLEQLVKIFREYGEVKRAKAVAEEIIKRREIKAFATTADLAELVERVDKVTGRKKSSAMLYFQALRIAVNDELGELEMALENALSLLKVGGRLAVITFHSLEDRMVKQFINKKSANCICPPGFPICVCNTKPELKAVNRKAMSASEGELKSNSRSTCAKLRVAEKILEVQHEK